MEKVITEGGLKQEWRRRRAEERKVKGTGMGGVVRWNRKARINDVHCRTGKGNLQSLATRLGQRCVGSVPEMETYCPGLHTRRGRWEAVDDPERWQKKMGDPGEDYEIDLVETFWISGEGMSYEFPLYLLTGRWPGNKGRGGGGLFLLGDGRVMRAWRRKSAELKSREWGRGGGEPDRRRQGFVFIGSEGWAFEQHVVPCVNPILKRGRLIGPKNPSYVKRYR